MADTLHREEATPRRSVVLYVRIPGDLFEAMVAEARAYQVSNAAFVGRALAEYLTAHFGWDGPQVKGLP